MAIWEEGSGPTTGWDQEAGMTGNANQENVATLAARATQAASNAEDSEDAAALSATAAAGSVTAAAGSATLAGQHKTAAETAQGLAETAQGLSESARDAALGYSNTASGHATTATTQAGIATTQASTATTQASAATTQAGIATTQAGIATTKASEAAASATSAAASYDNFDDRYLGSKANDPTVDNDGDALLTGALYFNSTTDAMKVYDGAAWVTAYASIAGITLNDVTTDGNTTTNAITVGGMTSTGPVILNADPSSNLGAATKQYVDTIAAAGIHYHDPVRVEQEGNLNATYDSGSSGVGATLTNSGTQEALVIDGVTLLSGDRVLIYEQTNQAHNGVYTVTDVGSGSTNWVLTRAVDADSYAPSDPDSFGQGDAFYVQEGLMGAGETYVMTTEGPITFGTTTIHFSQISSAQVYSGSTGIDITGTTISSTATLANVTTAGNSTTNSITVGGITSTGLITASNLNTSNWDTAYGWGNHGGAGYYVNGSAGFNSTGIDDNATSTAITIDASEKVGIGTDSPSEALTVAGSGTSARISLTDTDSARASMTGLLEFDGTDGRAGFVGYDSGDMSLYAAIGDIKLSTGGAARLTIDETSGNVGIGTSSPAGITSDITALSISDAGAKTTGEKIGALTFITNDGSYTSTYSDGVGVELAAVAESATGGSYGLAVYTGTTTGTNRDERVRITSSGDVGIGNSPVKAKMYIRGANNQGAPSTSIDSTLTLMTGTGGVGSGGELRFAALDNPAGQAAIKSYATDGGGNSQGYMDFYIRPNTADTSMTLGMRLGTQGSLTVTGNVTAYSDERLKDNVETLDGSKVYEMRGVSFTKDGESGSGVIAQELQKVAPELVNESGEYLSVAYGNLVGYLIEAVKELKAEIDELKGAN